MWEAAIGLDVAKSWSPRPPRYVKPGVVAKLSWALAARPFSRKAARRVVRSQPAVRGTRRGAGAESGEKAAKGWMARSGSNHGKPAVTMAKQHFKSCCRGLKCLPAAQSAGGVCLGAPRKGSWAFSVGIRAVGQDQVGSPQPVGFLWLPIAWGWPQRL